MNKLRIGGVPEHFNLPWHLALESGRLHAIGIDAEWRDFADGTGAMVAALDDGEIDVALLLTEGAVAGAARGAAIEILGVFVESPLIWGIHVPAGSRFTEVEQLATARFAISRHGSGSHLMSLALAEARGWPIATLELVVVGTLEGAIESFRAGRSDVFLWERFMTQPVVDRGDFRRIGEFVAPWPAFVVCASRPALELMRPDIERMIVAVGEEASTFAASAGAVETIASRYGLNPAGVTEWLAATRWARGLSSPDAAVAEARRMLVRAGVVAP